MKARGCRCLPAQCISFIAKILHILIVLFAVDAESITAQSQPLQKVRIAYASSGINYADIFLAKKMGFYREEGLEPQFIQMNSAVAITTGISEELDKQASIGSAIRALQRGAPLRVVAVTLRRPLYWLVVRPEYRSVKDLKGKVLGISTIGGSQHNRAKAMLAMGGLDPDRDITSMQINDQTMQLQALVTNAVQVIALSPPWVAVARDKFKMNILDSALEKFAGIDSGLAVPLKLLQDKPDRVKKCSGHGRKETATSWKTNGKAASSWRASMALIRKQHWSPIVLPCRHLLAPAFRRMQKSRSIWPMTRKRSSLPSRCIHQRSLTLVCKAMFSAS